jgi:serine/threonine-protein phosphatase 6 regulatory ankyrin repeat subunit B
MMRNFGDVLYDANDNIPRNTPRSCLKQCGSSPFEADTPLRKVSSSLDHALTWDSSWDEENQTDLPSNFDSDSDDEKMPPQTPNFSRAAEARNLCLSSVQKRVSSIDKKVQKGTPFSKSKPVYRSASPGGLLVELGSPVGGWIDASAVAASAVAAAVSAAAAAKAMSRALIVNSLTQKLKPHMAEHTLANKVVPQILAVATLKIAKAITTRLVEKIAQQVTAKKMVTVVAARMAELASKIASSAAVDATAVATAAIAEIVSAVAAQAEMAVQATADAQAAATAASVAIVAASELVELVREAESVVDALAVDRRTTVDAATPDSAARKVTTIALEAAGSDCETATSASVELSDEPLDHSDDSSKLNAILTQSPSLESTFEDEQDPTQLMLAAFQGYIAAAKTLLAIGNNVDEETSCGSTALLFAVRGGQVEMADFLLARGANVSQINKHGWSPLLEACAKGDVEIAGIMLDHGASAQQVDEEGNGALIVSCRSGRGEVVKLLLDRSLRKYSRRQDRQCPILARTDKKQTLQLDMNATNVMGYTALMLSSQCGHEPVVKLLLLAGANVRQSMEREGYTALHFACGNGHAAVACLLLSHGADSFAASSLVAAPFSSTAASTSTPHSDSRSGGYTCLHLACANGKLDVTRLLLKHDSHSRSVGVDESPCADGTTLVEFPAADGTTALMAASQHGRCDLAHILLLEAPGGSAGVDIVSGSGTGGGSVANVRIIGNVSSSSSSTTPGGQINAQQCDGWSALMFAVEGGYSEFAMLLLMQGANLSLRSYSKGETALMIAAAHGDDTLIKLLLLHGGDVHERGVGGKTSLLLAIESANVSACRVLLENGALDVAPAKKQQHADLEIQQQQMGMGRQSDNHQHHQHQQHRQHQQHKQYPSCPPAQPTGPPGRMA